MLQQESGHKARNDEEAPVHEGAQRQADQRHTRRVGFQGALDIPFLIEFREPALDGFRPRRRTTCDVLLRLPANGLVVRLRSVQRHAGSGGREHGCASSVMEQRALRR